MPVVARLRVAGCLDRELDFGFVHAGEGFDPLQDVGTAPGGHKVVDSTSFCLSALASAHVATFGERVVDVFYVTDLLGAQVTTPIRQTAIKRPLLALFTAQVEGKPAKEAAE